MTSHVTRSEAETSALGRACKELGVPLLPGVATGSEIMAAMDDGYTEMKFFPAVQSGGVPMLKAWQGPFFDATFCPTGGVTATNARSYQLRALAAANERIRAAAARER